MTLFPGAVMAALLGLAGCGPSVSCDTAETVLAEVDGDVLTCGEGQQVVAWIELLAGRPMQASDRVLTVDQTRKRFVSDAPQTRAWLAELQRAGAALEPQFGLIGAERRSTAVYEAVNDTGLIRERDGVLWNIQSRALSVWTRDDEERLAMTEMDMEGWILYASLCREVQGAGPLRLSVADKVPAYQQIKDRFDAGDRERQIAMTAVGPYWQRVTDAWKSATYTRQQEWIAHAPLPPPMTATSLGYAEAVITSDPRLHVKALHHRLGPFTLNRSAPRFGAAP